MPLMSRLRAGCGPLALALIALLLGSCATPPEAGADAPLPDAPVTAAPAAGAGASEGAAASRGLAARQDDASDDDGEPDEFDGMLAAHNRWRRQIGTAPLVWSRSAAQVAQAWADELARRDCRIGHSPGNDRRMTWGENIYSYWRGGRYEGWRKTPEFVVDRWVSEAQWYDRASNTCRAPQGEVCGHFTQVVSTYSTHVGCGRARCATAEVWVCNYAPPGNYRGVPPY